MLQKLIKYYKKYNIINKNKNISKIEIYNFKNRDIIYN